MIRYRPFQNSDPPAIARLWQTQPPARGKLQGVSAAMLEELVFGKPYFDREGLLLAEDGGQVIGVCHAWTLGDDSQRNASGAKVSGKAGTTGLLLVGPHPNREQVAAELLRHAEAYLHRKQCEQLFGGNAAPFDHFYLGIYSGCNTAGILSSDCLAVRTFEQRGYAEESRLQLWGRALEGFRPPIDRVQRTLKNDYEVRLDLGLLPQGNWEQQAWAHAEWNLATLHNKRTEEAVASLIFWDLEPLAKDAMEPTFGLVLLQDSSLARSSGLTLFLLGETLQKMQRDHGLERGELIALDQDVSLQEIYRKLEFAAYDSGILFRKHQPK